MPPVFRERAEESGGLPRCVEREFEEYLRCGLLEWGCLALVGRSCGHSTWRSKSAFATSSWNAGQSGDRRHIGATNDCLLMPLAVTPDPDASKSRVDLVRASATLDCNGLLDIAGTPFA